MIYFICYLVPLLHSVVTSLCWYCARFVSLQNLQDLAKVGIGVRVEIMQCILWIVQIDNPHTTLTTTITISCWSLMFKIQVQHTCKSSCSCFTTGKISRLTAADESPLSYSVVEEWSLSLVSGTISMYWSLQESSVSSASRLTDSITLFVTESADIFDQMYNQRAAQLHQNNTHKSKHVIPYTALCKTAEQLHNQCPWPVTCLTGVQVDTVLPIRLLPNCQ